MADGWTIAGTLFSSLGLGFSFAAWIQAGQAKSAAQAVGESVREMARHSGRDARLRWAYRDAQDLLQACWDEERYASRLFASRLAREMSAILEARDIDQTVRFRLGKCRPVLRQLSAALEPAGGLGAVGEDVSLVS